MKRNNSNSLSLSANNATEDGEFSSEERGEKRRGGKWRECENKKQKLVEMQNEPSKVPVLMLREKATVHFCEIGGNNYLFITHVDLKRVVAEQLELNKTLMNSALQIVENTLCAESPRFEAKEYSPFFSFPKNCTSTRVFFLFTDRKLGKKTYVRRDEERKRWLIFLTKKYKHFEGLPCISINDSQLFHKKYEGPKEKLKEMLFRLGFAVTLESPASNPVFTPTLPAASCVEIKGLLFHLNGFVMQDHCDSGVPYELSIKGNGFLSPRISSLSLSISPAPVSYRPPNSTKGKLHWFHSEIGAVYMLDCETLLEFLPEKNRDILEKISLDSPHFVSPFPEDGGAQLRPFLLLEFLHIEGVFEMKRMEEQKALWQLYLFSEEKCVLIDCSEFPTVGLGRVDPSLSNFHLQLHQMGRAVRPPTENLPPNYATQLEIKENYSDTTIPGISAPSMKEGFYLVWLTAFGSYGPFECVSKPFFVGNPTL